LASHPGHFTLRDRVPATHWIGGWVGPRTTLDRYEGVRKITQLLYKSEVNYSPKT